MLTQNEICDILQRYYGKRQSGAYRFMRDLTLDIATETGIHVSVVEACLKRNGVNC